MKIKMTYVIVMMNSDDDDVNIDKRVELFRNRHMTVIMKGMMMMITLRDLVDD